MNHNKILLKIVMKFCELCAPLWLKKINWYNQFRHVLWVKQRTFFMRTDRIPRLIRVFVGHTWSFSPPKTVASQSFNNFCKRRLIGLHNRTCYRSVSQNRKLNNFNILFFFYQASKFKKKKYKIKTFQQCILCKINLLENFKIINWLIKLHH